MSNALSPTLAVLFLASALAAQRVDFTHDLGLPVGDLQRIDAPDAAAIAATAKVTGHPEELLRAVQFHQGTVENRAGKHEAVLAQIGLPEPFAGCRLALAVTAEGRVVGLGLWGNADFDDDPKGRWTAYLGNLQGNRDLWEPDGETTRTTLMEALRSKPQDERRLVERLLAQRQIMQATAMAMAQFRLQLRRDQVPEFADAAWIARAARGLAAGAPLYAERLGEDGVAAYLEHATTLADMLDAFVAIDPATPLPQVQEVVSKWMKQDTCTKCHDAGTAGDDGVRKTLAGYRQSLQLPRGVLLVGYDLPPAPGDRDRSSQVIANALRAGLLLAQKIR